MTAPEQAATPNVDSAEFPTLFAGETAWCVYADFARTLERELAALTQQRDALREVLADAQEELRLIRMKDSIACYDPTLRIRISAALSATAQK